MKYPDFSDAACKGLDVEMFFLSDPEDKIAPKKDHRYLDEQMLSKMCNECPIKPTCLEWALRHEQYGYWAGTTERKRMELRRKYNITLELPQLLGYLRNVIAK